MNDIVKRVAQHWFADVLRVCCIEITVTLDLYLGLQIFELQIEEVSPIAAIRGLVLDIFRWQRRLRDDVRWMMDDG